MPDLDAEIRAKLAVYTGFAEHVHGEEVFAPLVDAILAALDVHKPEHINGYKGAKGWDNCASCRDTNWGGPDVAWPCETVEAMAKALGIEVPDA